MGFMTYDLVFLVAFSLFVVVFLYARRDKIERQGILYLYKTKIGINFIDRFAKKYRKLLGVVQYLVLASGYILMVSMIWLLIKSVYIYLTSPLVREVFGKTPPVMPLIPYAPQLFGLSSYFPPLYFTYFILALVVVAVTHEFSHGIFARLHGFKIHSTGFAFLGPILGAFVEPDEKEMEKAKRFPQLTVLAAGTFANVLMFALFGLIMLLFFSAAFVPAGVKYDSYAMSVVDISSVSVIGNSNIEGYLEVESSGVRYYVQEDSFDSAVDGGYEQVIVYDDSPAFQAQIPLGGAIRKINDVEIQSYSSLGETLSLYQPGDSVDVEIAVLTPGQGTVSNVVEETIELGEKEGKAFLGVGFIPAGREGLVGSLMKPLDKVKDPMLHYESEIGDFGWFVYYLLWWIVAINILVALFNMLPLGILDGGRYFMLTVWGLTGSKKFGERAFKFVTWFILGLVILMMLQWIVGFF